MMRYFLVFSKILQYSLDAVVCDDYDRNRYHILFKEVYSNASHDTNAGLGGMLKWRDSLYRQLSDDVEINEYETEDELKKTYLEYLIHQCYSNDEQQYLRDFFEYNFHQINVMKWLLE